METYKFIPDTEEELKFFWEYGIAPLAQNEVYFVSLSCRNKCLNEQEREYYKVSRSEMFAKQIIRHDDYEVLLQHLKRFEVRKDAYLTKSGHHYPQKALRIYFNICNIDAFKAMKDQINYLTETLSSLADSAVKNSQGGITDSLKKVKKSFDASQSLFARNFGHKEWIDIDIDIDHNLRIPENNFEKVIFPLIKVHFDKEGFQPGDIMYVKTSGGVHCLIRKSKLKTNPNRIANDMYNIGKMIKESVVNSNFMIPLPGTLMDENFLVHVLNKEDFKPEHKLHETN